MKILLETVALALCLASPAGTPERAWLGLVLQRDEGPGLRVEQVASGSPALQAGLIPGDRLLALDGEIADFVPALLLDHEPGDALLLLVERGTRALELPVLLAAWPEGRDPPPLPVYRSFDASEERPSPLDRQEV